MADVIQNIRQEYRSLLQNDSQLSQLRNKLIKGDLAALQKYSMRAGQLAVRALQESVSNESIDQSSVENALDAVFRENYDAVVNASSVAQKALNQNSGIGLNASDSDYSGENVKRLADQITSYDDLNEGLSKSSNDIVAQSQRYADDSERRSAQFDNDSGLEVLVSREYDDVGVHTTDKDGGKPCQWCLDRCGTDVPYEEAYEMGMFERHPGCGCIITYKTKKGIYRQGKGDWLDNSWSKVSESERDKRIDFSESGDNIGSSLKTPRQKVFEAIINSEKPNDICPHLVENHEALGDYTPTSLKKTLDNSRFKTLPLSRGELKEKQYSDNGGYKAIIGNDGMISYHPAGGRHHNGEAYYKISSGKTGVKRYHLDGTEKND